MLKKQFKFKVSKDTFSEELEDAFSERLDECYRSIVYNVKESEHKEGYSEVSWLDPETNGFDSVDYENEAIEHLIKKGSWIIVEES